VAVGGVFDSDPATGVMPAAQRVARQLSIHQAGTTEQPVC
jgi:hypothetical protein